MKIKSILYFIPTLLSFNLMANDSSVVVEDNSFKIGSAKQVVVTGCYGNDIHRNLSPSVKTYKVDEIVNDFYAVVVDKANFNDKAVRSAIVQLQNVSLESGKRYSYGLEMKGKKAKVWLVDEEDTIVSDINEFEFTPNFSKPSVNVRTSCKNA